MAKTHLFDTVELNTLKFKTANNAALLQSLLQYALTGTNAQSLLDFSGTWNTTGTPTLVNFNVVDTASNAASLLMNMLVSGVSKFSISKAGNVIIAGNFTASGTLNLTGLATMSGGIQMSDSVLQRPEIKDYSETKTTVTIVSGVVTLDLELGNVFELVLNANVTSLVVSHWPASGKKGSFELWVKADGTQRTFSTTGWRTFFSAGYTPTATLDKYDALSGHSWNAGTDRFLTVAGQSA